MIVDDGIIGVYTGVVVVTVGVGDPLCVVDVGVAVWSIDV